MDVYRERLYDEYVETQLGGVDVDSDTRRKPYLRRLIKYLPRDHDAAILELGCGHGSFLSMASEAGYKYLEGVDRSIQQVQTAIELGHKNIRRQDIMDALKEKASESVDTVVSIDVIEHFAKSEVLELVEEVYRVLKKGGQWILHMPNAASPFFGRVRYGDYTHEQAYTQRSIRQVLQTCGFENITCIEDRPIVHGIKSAIRWICWMSIRNLFRLVLAAEGGCGKEIFSQNMLVVAMKKQ